MLVCFLVRFFVLTFNRLSPFPRVAKWSVKKVRYITSRNMLTCGYQLQHRLLHFDVATFIQRFLFFTIVHRFANLLCEVIRSESADNLKPGQISILSQFKFTE